MTMLWLSGELTFFFFFFFKLGEKFGVNLRVSFLVFFLTYLCADYKTEMSNGDSEKCRVMHRLSGTKKVSFFPDL